MRRKSRFYLYLRHWDPEKRAKRLVYISPDDRFHDRAAVMIADQYYRSEESKTTTYVNVPTRRMGARLGNGQLVYVDILIIDDRNNRVQKAVEIETVVDDECARRLIAASRIAPSLDIYVVDGHGEKTRRILEHQHTSCARIFEYYFTPLDRLIVKPVTEPAGPEQVP